MPLKKKVAVSVSNRSQISTVPVCLSVPRNATGHVTVRAAILQPSHSVGQPALLALRDIQGGGVVNVMKKTPGWKVRAITRNPGSDAAKKLAAEGIEVVQADFDDEASLAKAFKGVHAIFAVTNWWEHLFRGKTQDEAGVVEEEQGMKLARAASLIPTLTHYIFSTTPSPKRMFKGKMRAPHMDYKANIDARIKKELP
ncbi:hypothetical protein HBI37_147980 [Parastagonospora nodorum]|nr:hypothetical protein HBH46_076480 [Parastagonospora nodorum]KAH4807415.1 hypothetical protein HBH61_132270 [Parastagonospora nodorum]KAH6335547.1 hypothetical protein HBI37_147980 [Parastagonospora nodorum]KAH6349256.1 hypothetical protein HBI36_134010 [Parastagonospora nodorum]